MIRKLLLAGGDVRALEMERLLRQDGFDTDTIGLHEGDAQTADPSSAQAVLFAYPFSVRDGSVPAANGMTIHPEDVLSKLRPGTLIVAGRGMTQAMAEPCRLTHYMEDEALEERNAQISAEAAMCEVMQRSRQALMDQTVLVTGYGRLAQALAQRLRSMGAEVWVAARRKAQLLLAEKDGMRVVPLAEMHRVLGRMDAVFNTVPARVMGERELQAMKKEVLLWELASAPYGLDLQRAQEAGLKCEVLPSLPARYAPISAGKALKEAAVRLLEEAEA